MNPKKISIKKSSEVSPTYVMKLDNEVIWEGKDLKRQMEKIKKDNPLKRVSIAWKSDQEFLIG